MGHGSENGPDVKAKIPERLNNFGASYPEAKYIGHREKYVHLVIACTRHKDISVPKSDFIFYVQTE